MIPGTLLATVTLLISLSAAASAPASWGFKDGSLTVQSKASGVGDGQKIDLSSTKPSIQSITLRGSESIKIQLTATDGGSPKKPNQAMLLLREQDTGLETFFAAQTRDSGKCSFSFSYKDLPVQLMLSERPLLATMVIASFGTSAGYLEQLFEIKVEHDPNIPLPKPEAQPRFGKKEHIHHIFRDGPQSPPAILTLVFSLAVLATVPLLFGMWIQLGGNVNSVGAALQAAPSSHVLFFGSILALEGIFFMYYTRWNLFQTLPPAGLASIVAFISGGRALTEVQERRLAGATAKSKSS